MRKVTALAVALGFLVATSLPTIAAPAANKGAVTFSAQPQTADQAMKKKAHKRVVKRVTKRKAVAKTAARKRTVARMTLKKTARKHLTRRLAEKKQLTRHLAKKKTAMKRIAKRRVMKRPADQKNRM